MASPSSSNQPKIQPRQLSKLDYLFGRLGKLALTCQHCFHTWLERTSRMQLEKGYHILAMGAATGPKERPGLDIWIRHRRGAVEGA
jgi:hypothetical protein